MLKDVFRSIIGLACLAATVGGLYNVFSDNEAVEASAKAEACESEPCTATITRMERSPISQKFQLHVAKRVASSADRGYSVDVICQRAYILFGEYACKLVTPSS